MTPERWQEVKKVLAGALERPPEERSVYLDQACTELALRQEVGSLIAAHEQGDRSFMEPPVAERGVLKSGTKLGPYTIVERIGAGGMGEVYRAHDPKLKRDVAVKILPSAFVNDPERLARFQREARLLASLNYPNIAAIYGLEESGSTRALVMELAEGPTLAERIRHGPIPIDEALPIAKQICDALEYAHEHGIVHRDLKPANIKVAADDTIKILDFGLAKALAGDAGSADMANSPTISQLATEAGVLLGTAAYMSPEQAKGKPVDRRADIWAFGCVLYEMLTGQRAFHGETVTDTLAAVLKNDPDWTQLPGGTPMRVHVLLQRCLQKDPKQRLQAIGDARIALEEVLSGAPEGAPSFATGARPAQRWWLRPSLTAVCLLIAVAGWLAFLYLRPKPPVGQAVRFEVPLPEKLTLGGQFTLSPDGRKLAFIAADTNRRTRVWVRSLETLEARPLASTEGAFGFPIWSPDSRYIAYVAQGKLMKIEASGGPPVTLCNAMPGYGGAWNRDDKIVFGSPAGLLQVAASGGSPTPITTDIPSGVPFFLPDQHHFVYWRAGDQWGGSGIYVGLTGTKPQEQVSKKLLSDDCMPVFTPSSNPAVGYLLFVREIAPGRGFGTLMAQPFDTRRLELTGEAVPIAEEIPVPSFSASATDVLVYFRGSPTVAPGGASGNVQGQLTWFDREGKVLGTAGEPGWYRSLALSPDGKRVAFERADLLSPFTRNIWLYDFARGVTTRFTFASAWDSNPVWSPDGSLIAFTSNRSETFDLYQKSSNLAGEDEILFKSGDNKVPSSWSPDGRFLLYYSVIPSIRLWLLPLGGEVADRKSVSLERSEFNQAAARFSPDGGWFAYNSDESGRNEIYVRPFDASSAMGSRSERSTPITGKWMVSKDGGTTPLWRRDGKELFYLSLDGTAMAVEVSTSGVFQAGIPKALFKVPRVVLFWDVASDGKRFLMAAPSTASSNAQPSFTVVLNWQAALKK